MDATAVTLDIDWAPDCVIDDVAALLLRHNVKATWFVTHSSPAVDRLRQYPDQFELGAHPNLLPGSTHGSTTAEILRHCVELVPEAVSLRTHGLVQSTGFFGQVLKETPWRADVSLYLAATPNLQPTELWWAGESLLRIPYMWEDDLEMERPAPNWSPTLKMPGLKVFDFHPIHVYLNSASMEPYQALKAACPNIRDASPELLRQFRVEGFGTRTCFEQLLATIGSSSQRITDVAQRWCGASERAAA